MSARCRSLVAALIVGGALMAVPAAASATVYFAEHDGGAGTGTCSQVGDACSLSAAITAARATTGQDIIQLDAGDFTTSTVLGTMDADTTIQGSGAGATRLNNAGRVLQINGSSPSEEFTLSSLTLNDTGGADSNTLDLTLGTLTLSDVTVARSASSGNSNAFNQSPGTTATIRRSTLQTAGATNLTSHGSLELTGSALIRNAPSIADLMVVGGNGNAQIDRTSFEGEGSTGSGLRVTSDQTNQDAYASVQDATIHHTAVGLLVTRDGGGGNVNTNAIATLDHVTIVPNSTGPSIETKPNGGAVSSIPGFRVRADVRNSILATAPSNDSTISSNVGTICDWTAVPADLTNDDGTFASCSPGVTNSGVSRNDIAYSPSMLNPDSTLAAGSAAIDAGDPAALGAVLTSPYGLTFPNPIVESSTDLAGNPRVVAGKCGDAARRDLGAYEAPAQLPATGTIHVPATVTQGTPAAFTFTSPSAMASVHWTFGDGGQSAALAPSYTYATTGTKTVSLELHPVSGCVATVTATVNVKAKSVVKPPPSTKLHLAVNVIKGATIKKGVKMTVTPTKAGTVKVVVTQKSKGYRKSRKAKCGAVKHGKKSNCTRVVKVLTKSYALKAGNTVVTLKLPKKYKAGTYSATFTLTAGGKTSNVVGKSLKFKKK
jgi:hypothetical protein